MLKDDSGLQPQRTYLANERTLFSILATSFFISKILANSLLISVFILIATCLYFSYYLFFSFHIQIQNLETTKRSYIFLTHAFMVFLLSVICFWAKNS